MTRFLVMLAVAATWVVFEATDLSAMQQDLSPTPAIRAAAMKQHLERWLEVHRPDLSSNAQGLVREAIDFVTPELYANPPTEAKQQQQLRLAERLACALGGARAATLMKLDLPPQRISQTWSENTREWIDWLVNCAGR